jgi:hypothetical protein
VYKVRRVTFRIIGRSLGALLQHKPDGPWNNMTGIHKYNQTLNLQAGHLAVFAKARSPFPLFSPTQWIRQIPLADYAN